MAGNKSDFSDVISLRKDGSTLAIYKQTARSQRLEIIEKGSSGYSTVSLKSGEEVAALRDFINKFIKEGGNANGS